MTSLAKPSNNHQTITAMKAITSTLHIAILAALAFTAFFGILSIPTDNSATWGLDLLISKAIGFAAAYLTAKAYCRWSKTDPWLIAYGKMCDEDLAKPNPSQL